MVSIRSIIRKKVSDNEPISSGDLLEFMAIARKSGHTSDRVLFARAKRLIEKPKRSYGVFEEGKEQAE